MRIVRENLFGSGFASGFMMVLIIHALRPDIVDSLTFMLPFGAMPIVLAMSSWAGKNLRAAAVIQGFAYGGVIAWALASRSLDLSSHIRNLGDQLGPILAATAGLISLIVVDRRKGVGQQIELERLDLERKRLEMDMKKSAHPDNGARQ